MVSCTVRFPQIEGNAPMSKHYDTLETRTPEEREKALMQALPQQIAHAKANAPFFARWLKDVDPAAVTSRAALAKLPVLRKSMLGEVQKKNPPMGGLIAVPLAKARHIFMSPGPIFEIDTDEPDYFRGARAMYAGGLPSRRRGLQHLLVSPDARRHHDGIGAQGAGLRDRAGRRRQHRAAARRDRGDQAQGLCRHAVLPEDPDREGGRNRQGHLLDQARLRRRRGAAAVAAPDVHRQGHDLPAELRHGRPRHDRLRVRSRSRA